MKLRAGPHLVGRARSGVLGPALAAGAFAIALFAAKVAPAHANGAFPDSLQILVPSDQPHRIILATNFGLLVTEDDAMSWHWICEAAIASNAFLFQIGPMPTHELFALGFDGLFFSKNAGCSFSHIGGRLDSLFVNDYFVDPLEEDHVFLAGQPTTATAADVLYESRGSEHAFDRLVYTAPMDTRIETVENARADPRIIYATLSGVDPPKTLLIRSRDGGGHFDLLDRTDDVERRYLRIASIDPSDPSTVYFRAISRESGDDDALAITRNGGDSIEIAFRLQKRMSAFLRRSDGALIVASMETSFISTDGGAHFVEWTGAPHLRALAERNSAIYAAGDNFRDFFALAVSLDKGATWKPLVRYDQICGVVACPELHDKCDRPYRDLIGFFGLSCDMNGVRDMPVTHDAGTSSTPPPAKKKSGCGCSALTERGGSAHGSLFGALAFVLFLGLRASWKRRILRALRPKVECSGSPPRSRRKPCPL